MEEANAAWEKEVERRNSVKNKRKEEKAAKKKARKEAKEVMDRKNDTPPNYMK